MTPFALKQMDLAVCWSSNLQQIVKPMLREGVRCEVVVGGVDSRVFRRRTGGDVLRRSLGFRADDFVVLSPRLFRPLSNIETILRAFSTLVQNMPKARLLLVKYLARNYPDYDQRMEALIDELAIRDRVKTLHDIPNGDMPLYYCASDCVVSIPDTDGTPMTVMESAACGTPVLIQDLPDYDPEIFVDGETVLKVANDAEKVAQAIIRLASDTRLSERLTRNGERMAIRHSDFNSEMGRLEQMYFRLTPDAKGGIP
jgi:glycosyltransferase involved in cell wall biosynthesis